MRSAMAAIFGERIKARAAIPHDFERVTVRLKVGSEAHLIQSIWDSLKGTEALVTVGNGRCQFWRRRKPQALTIKRYTAHL
jgi:hypothetical protein